MYCLHSTSACLYILLTAAAHAEAPRGGCRTFGSRVEGKGPKTSGHREAQQTQLGGSGGVEV